MATPAPKIPRGTIADGRPAGGPPEGEIAAPLKGWYERRMEELFGHPAYKGFVLQDVKRLPARFFARVSGPRTARAG